MEQVLAVSGQELPLVGGTATIEKIRKPDPTPDTIGNEVEVCRHLRETASQCNVKTQVHPDPSAAQAQPATTPKGATTGTTPVVAGAKATTTESQSTASGEMQVPTPVPTDGTFAGAKVPDNSLALAVRPPIVALSATEALSLISPKPSVADMTLEEKFTALKQGFAHGYGIRRILVEVFESIRDEVKTYAKDRAGMPTVEEAFKQRGLNYHTVYSAIQREKIRRAEDAQFFDAIKAEHSTNNIHGADITDNDLPPVNTEVVVDGGRQAIVVTHGVTDGSGKTAEVIYKDDSTSEIVKAGDLVTLADFLAKKAAAKAARDAVKAAEENDEDGKRKKEDAETARIAAAAAKKDAALKSADFYAAQYFALVALINGAPKEMTPAEFARTVNDNLRFAYESLNAEEAKLVKALPTFPSFKGTKGMTDLIAFLSEDAIGRPSPLKTIFGGLDKDKFRDKVGTFAQRVCDRFYEGECVVTVGNRGPAETKAAPPASKPNQPPAKAGTATDATPHGFYAKLTRETEFGTPWHVFQIGGSKKPIAFAQNKQDAELEAAKLERKFLAETATEADMK